MAEAAETDLGNFNDGMSEAERHFFESGGDVTEALTKEHAAPPTEPPAPVEPAAEPAVDAVHGLPEPGAPAADDDEPAAAAAPGESEPQPLRVSYKRFQEVEKARIAAEKQLQEQAIRQARVEERLSLLQQVVQEPPAQEQVVDDPEPDPEQDIFAYVRWQQRQLAATQQKVRDYEEQIVTGQAEMDNERRYIESINSYAGTQPDFGQAYQFLLQKRQLELLQQNGVSITVDPDTGRLQVPEVPPEVKIRVGNQLRQEERSLYLGAWERNVNPGAEIYNLALLNGYRRPAAAKPNGNGAARPNGNGAAQPVGTPLGQQPQQRAQAAPAAAAPAPGQPTASEIVASLQKGQAAAQSLSNAGGKSIGLAQLTPEMLANMSDEEFEAVYSSLSPQRQRELMGQ